ncbi:DUF7553 family protein [Halosolutus gelatinilyticus]|uniref:DUF7553 family protein n=1 Tax=Halosolutus gelatinilyticus TaxID=2931975 RepID=UPI001FF46A61|nr:hypothetical protein [Halosolutus gelatinilyticus]
MNKHFSDSLYYLKRAGEHARLGLREALDRVETRVRTLTGREAEPETRLDRIRGELEALEAQVEGRAKAALEEARTSISAYRRRSETPIDRS